MDDGRYLRPSEAADYSGNLRPSEAADYSGNLRPSEAADYSDYAADGLNI